MDFINRNIKRLNLYPEDKFGFVNRVPQIPSNEIEQLHNDLFKSIKMRAEHKIDNQNNQESFEKLVQQMHGQDTSNISDLTKDFERKTKRNY